MKAIVYKQYGPPEVLTLQEVDKPTLKDTDLLIKVHATTVTSGDCRMRRADPFAVRFVAGLAKPKLQILGTEFSGVVEAVGQDVTQFKTGDPVFGSTELNMGTYAEYLCLPETGAVAIKPHNMTFEQAAAVPFGATTSLFFLRDKGNIQPGQNILVYGASGGLGTFAIQLAKSFGATVTGVCSSSNIALIRSLGADAVVDYTREDFTTTDARYDLIFDTVGKTSFSLCKQLLKPDGIYLAAAAGVKEFAQMFWTSRFSQKKVIGGVAFATKEKLNFLKERIEAGAIQSVIDRCYPLEQTAEAHRYVDQGHKKGNVVINIVPE
jgi:NADPH2:quinone reductase